MPIFALIVVLWLVSPGIAAAAADPMLFRLFLTDGTSLVSYGEFARLDDRVVFSLVAGGETEPALQIATLPASRIDWMKTDRHARSTRYQWYAKTRGDEDFLQLSDRVASVLNQVVQTRDRTRALDVALQARATLAEWPRQHYGYRQQEVREILSFLDEVISDLRAASGLTSFSLDLVASPPDVVVEPLATMPSPRDQVDQLIRTAMLTDGPAERVALLKTALTLIEDASPTTIAKNDLSVLRRRASSRLKLEEAIDDKYAALARRLVADAIKGAERARVEDVQRVMNRLPREDARLGGHRPGTVRSIRVSVESQLAAARRLRLLQDRWRIRRTLYQDYQRTVGAQLLQLGGAQPALEAIRRLDGPTPESLLALRARLLGGAAQLERIRPPEDLRETHDLLLGAWRFAESAINGRYNAARAGDVSSAWQASAAAGGALVLLSRVREEIRESLEPPTLQ